MRVQKIIYILLYLNYYEKGTDYNEIGNTFIFYYI